MISRRGFFGMLAGLASAPVVAPLAKILPGPTGYTTYLLGDEMLIHLDPKIQKRTWDYYNRVFKCGSEQMGTLYWSKQSLSE